MSRVIGLRGRSQNFQDNCDKTDYYKNEIIKNLTESLVDSRSGFKHIYKKTKFCTLAKTAIRQQDSRTNKPPLPIKNTILAIKETTNGTERHSPQNKNSAVPHV